MVQKEPPRRGRPRAYDPEQALDRAMETFWDTGFSGTSLDELSDRTGMNRPSLYGAFGDKEALYLKTLERYREVARAALGRELAVDRPLADGLRAVYRRALDLYLGGEVGARGCYMIGTAATEAVTSAPVRALLNAAFREIDDGFAWRLRKAHAAGELAADADPEMLAMMASAVLHSLALRARAGAARPELDAFLVAAVDRICGAPARKASPPRARAAKRGRP
jgi:AcrR family transcriptional regulator